MGLLRAFELAGLLLEFDFRERFGQFQIDIIQTHFPLLDPDSHLSATSELTELGELRGPVTAQPGCGLSSYPFVLLQLPVDFFAHDTS
jgi:hypothetical protein